MKNRYKAVLVDDERLARNELKSMLTDYSEIIIIGEAGNVESAKSIIEELKPDIVFLDIQMPGESGFDLINSIDITTNVIFVTAYDEYALRAFEVNALDYLLKPINPDRLKQAVDKLKSGAKEEVTKYRKLNEDDRLLIAINSKLHFLKVNTIIYINSAGDYTEINTSERIKGVTLKPIKEWEFRLPETMFVRIHRSTIVNMDYIDRFEEWFNNSYRVYLKNIDEPFVVSRRYSAKLKERFS